MSSDYKRMLEAWQNQQPNPLNPKREPSMTFAEVKIDYEDLEHYVIKHFNDEYLGQSTFKLTMELVREYLEQTGHLKDD